MPTYRSITASLVSQFDLMVIPEYPPPENRQDHDSTLPTLISEELSLISVFIPTYSGSQFWISYSIAPPYPPKALFYFKLFLNGASVVSWGCGKDDGYKGKTVFGLYKSDADEEGESSIQKRILCFREESRGSDDDILEMKVYRCKGRRPCSPTLESYGRGHMEIEGTSERETNGNLSLVNVGAVDEEHPRNFYQYALIDPLDTPFARFRYYYRPWAQLQRLGVVSPSSSCSSSLHSEGGEGVQRGSHQGFHRSALTYSSDESSPRRSISDHLGHPRPLVSRGAGSPSKLLPSPSPSPPAPPLRSSHSSPAILVTSPNTPCPSKRVRATSKTSFAALVRSAIPSPPADSVPFTPPQHQPPKIPRTASLGMLKSVVTKAVKRRERSSSETEKAATENESVAEQQQQQQQQQGNNDGSKKKPNVPRRTSSTKATTTRRESDPCSKRDEERRRGQNSTKYAKKASRRSSTMFWEGL